MPAKAETTTAAPAPKTKTPAKDGGAADAKLAGGGAKAKDGGGAKARTAAKAKIFRVYANSFSVICTVWE